MVGAEEDAEVGTEAGAMTGKGAGQPQDRTGQNRAGQGKSGAGEGL